MSNVAVGAALGASVASSSNSDARKSYYCNQIMPAFNPKTATVKDKQNYASCVEHFHPLMSPTDIIAIKVIIILSFIAFFCGVWIGYKEKEWILVLLNGLLLPLLTFFGLLLAYFGLSFVFGFGG